MVYDISDSLQLDSKTGQDLNPERDWYFRLKNNVDPLGSGQLIGWVMIGKVSPQTTDNDLENLFSGIALPDKESGERCHHWVWRAVSALQNESVIPKFDIKKFKDWLLDYANQWLAKPDPRTVHDYR
ncbi:uncharacterized protein CIMG_03300 [Coccidioides immitis RS]|uniref:Uncharacterized protein n=3 Tax=Coccidioides immitis TaxID=5501 RepID=A0A0E1RWN4_COCIM|nr:uncharacterized protein CIMG_03300 [Coccidioides immitis RS]EAS32276.1 hypothetical protein CIMG_03300 [Coccidioides immitis RS]KMP07492.1 hypothetical protein CIRG_07173 [Coccidioides immitis RMSCC 2394]KMU72058.1 hypothetical protein CISG_00367 [Coccidioides immitis RMSCC 3703]